MIVTLVALFPAHLNLNGDQANLFVMRKRLEWRGFEVNVLAVEKGENLPVNADFIFLGHGSMAAWSDISDEIERLAPQVSEAIASGTAFMAVASGYERAIELSFFEGSLEPITRISKFEIAQLGEHKILGYLNASSKAPVIQKHNLLLGTQLHGPVFAKNPNFADAYLQEILKTKGLSLVVETKSASAQNLLKIDSIVEALWELEEELASE